MVSLLLFGKPPGEFAPLDVAFLAPAVPQLPG